ncbi:MAG TPA: hypothetical protein DCW46_10005 [Desulfotomaculum sp.]|nr:hypothetical protein [Desulfotomaculum sp.]
MTAFSMFSQPVTLRKELWIPAKDAWAESSAVAEDRTATGSPSMPMFFRLGSSLSRIGYLKGFARP